LGVETAVTFEGWLDRAGVAAAMARAAVFVHPSPSETFGVAAAEAILTGLPVAARRSGGVPWVVERSGGFGRVADDDSAASFAAAIESILSGHVPGDGATAREQLLESVGAAAVARQTIGLYRDTLEASSSTPGAVAAAGLAVAGGRSDANPLPRIVLATGREGARRLVAQLPVDLQERLVLVLPAPIGEPEDPASMTMPAAHIIDAEPIPPPRPRPRGRGPLARLQRAMFRPSPTPDDLLAQAIDAAVRPTEGRQPVEIVAIDAPAVMVVERLGPSRVRLAPGSLRWLADRWDADTHGSGTGLTGARPGRTGMPP
jgi:hypothetical protein